MKTFCQTNHLVAHQGHVNIGLFIGIDYLFADSIMCASKTPLVMQTFRSEMFMLVSISSEKTR